MKKMTFLLFIITMATFSCSKPASETDAQTLASLKADYKNTFPKEESVSKNLAWLDIERISYIDEVITAAEDIRDNFNDVVLFGVGGSDLGARALQWALAHGSMYNSLPAGKRDGPRFFFAGGNANAGETNDLLSTLDPRKTLIIVVSKSGTTAETIGSFLPIFQRFQEVLGKNNVGSHIVAVTGNSDKSLLKKMNDEFHFRYIFNIEDGVGGRYSVLSPVGLLPAAILGIDVRRLVLGGISARDEALTNTSHGDLPSKIAMASVDAMSDGKNIIAFFPFDDRLKVFSSWFRQIWSESLGKLRKDGSRTGSTPLALVGSTDNHSVQQLILDGPRDKFVLLIGVQETPNDVIIDVPDGEDYRGLAYLKGVGLAQLLRVIMAATEKTYNTRGVQYLRFDLPAVDEFNIGKMIVQLELATAWAGGLLGIDPFVQPAVEEGKGYIEKALSPHQ